MQPHIGGALLAKELTKLPSLRYLGLGLPPRRNRYVAV
jgi:hypothetical protein